MHPLRPPNPYLAPGFLDPATCERVRAAMDRGRAEPAEVFDPGATLDLEARRAASIEVDAATLNTVSATLDATRQAIAAHFRLPLVTREGSGFLRYGAGGFYRRHRDRSADAAWPGTSRRLVSLVVFLNSSRSASADGEFSGGELIFFPDPADDVADRAAVQIAPRRGSLVAFHAATLHEVKPVAGGIRDVIVDWYYGPAEASPYTC